MSPAQKLARHDLLAAFEDRRAKAAKAAAEANMGEDIRALPPADRPWPKQWHGIFLKALSTLPDVTSARTIAGISKNHVYRTRDEVPGFADAWDEALEIARDAVQRRAYQWIMTGIPVKKTVTKEKDGVVVERMTTESVETYGPLMIFWLKAWFPERYRWSEKVETTGAEGGPIQIESLDKIDAQIAALSAELSLRAGGEPVPVEE